MLQTAASSRNENGLSILKKFLTISAYCYSSYRNLAESFIDIL